MAESGIQKLIPALRLNEFEDEWIATQLGEAVLSLDAGISVNSENTPTKNDELGILKTSCVSAGYFDETKNKIVSDPKEQERLKEPVTVGSIVISRMNTPALVGLSGLVTKTYSNLYLPDRLWAAKVADTSSAKFVALILASFRLRNVLSARATGTSGTMKNITKGDVLTLPIVLPTLAEQQKIADFLTAVDERIGQLIQKKALLEDYKKGVMQQLFSQTIRFKDDDGNDFPDWEENKLGEVSDVRDGTHESPKYQTQGYPLVTSKNLRKNGSIDMGNVDLISEEDFRAINKRSQVDAGDIVFGMIGTIGNPVIVSEAGFAIKNVALIKEQDRLQNKYLIHYLDSANISRQFYVENTGGTQKFIALGVIRKLHIRTPSIEEQIKIAKFLSSIDSKIGNVNTQITETQTFKRGLLQQMFL